MFLKQIAHLILIDFKVLIKLFLINKAFTFKYALLL